MLLGTGTPGNATPANGDEGPVDDVRLWEDGYEDRYYQQKFGKPPSDIEFRTDKYACSTPTRQAPSR